MRRLLKISAWSLVIGVLMVVALGGGIMLAGNTDAGRGWIERLTFGLTAGYVKLSGLGGSFPVHLTLRELQLIDHQGTWLVADDITLTWSPLRLLRKQIVVDTLQARRLLVERAPAGDGKPSRGKASVPFIEVGHFTVGAVALGAPLVGTATTLSAQGDLRLSSLEDARADLVARRLDGDGDYTLHVNFDPNRMEASLAVHEPASGPLEHLLTLPGLGTLRANVTLEGPRAAEVVALDITAGALTAHAAGTVDLVHSSADLVYALNAPALAPRPEVQWGALTLQGSWHGSLTQPTAAGHLQVDALRLADSTRLAKLTADLTASQGRAAVQGEIDGLEIPGPAPVLLAKTPVKFAATVQLNEPARPLQVTVVHALFSLRGHAETPADKTGQLTASLEMKLPDVAPFAEVGGQDVHGSGAITAKLVHGTGGDALSLDARVAQLEGKAAWVGMLGPALSLQVSGSSSADALTVDSARLAGRTLLLTASGSGRRVPGAAAGAAMFKDLQARWQLDLPDLAALSKDVAGTAKLSGRLNGPPASLRADADLTSTISVRGSPSGTVQGSLQASGLPTAPDASLRVHGMLDGSPLSLDATLGRSMTKIFHLAVRQAEWKSAHVDGDATADALLTESHGHLNLRVANLSDFNRLLGLPLAGSVTGDVGFVPGQGHTQAQASLEAKGLAVGGLAGDLHLKAHGVTDAVLFELATDVPDLYGSGATLSSTGQLNLERRELGLTTVALGYRGETLRLLVPAVVSFAAGVSIDDLRLGARDAVFELRGAVSPALDLHANLTQVKPDLVNALSPGLLAAGLIEARARLQGTVASPTGAVRIEGSGIRFADDAATGLPAVDLRARAELNGDAASVDAKLNAGAGSQLTATGDVPLHSSGVMSLKLGGKLDVGLINPLLEARGMRASGALTADATVAGTYAAPEVGGGLRLTQGSLRDYGRGVNLTDISADVAGNEGGLEIKRLSAKAASGTVAMSGTFEVLKAGWPVDLKITAKNAQPIASSIVTANLDADLRVSGMARQRIDVAGTVDVNRAVIGIPNSLPPDVAVLDVRRRGKKAAVAADDPLIVGVAITINAPRQILVQGRGLDAEMGGTIKLAGTTDALLASGGLDLQRGNFALGGNQLTFSTSSRISFDGAGLQKKIDPTLDFTASTTVNETTATLHITGFADAPKFEFTSSPPQGQDETMALLLFGKPANQLTALELAQVGAALATAGGLGGGGGRLNPLVKLQKSLGLDRLSVGSNTNTATGTESSGAAIAAGRYVSKRVYIEGRQTTTGTSQVQVDVDLTKHLKLQTRLGNGTAVVQGTTPDNDPGSSIGLSYQFEY